ncbi:MAG: hypothetical protein PF572_00045 [Patescibacteria group bacterium]|jgi:hypothetical protein|nr:hypothetical protein [Patescibacteria group bacterium]
MKEQLVVECLLAVAFFVLVFVGCYHTVDKKPENIDKNKKYVIDYKESHHV